MNLWIGPLILWIAFAVTIPAMFVVRKDSHRAIACWINGLLCAMAIFTTLTVAYP